MCLKFPLLLLHFNSPKQYQKQDLFCNYGFLITMHPQTLSSPWLGQVC